VLLFTTFQSLVHTSNSCLRAQPNAAHNAIAALSIHSIRSRILPSLSNPDVPPLFITQNYDSLSLRALQSLADSGLLSPEELDVAKEKLIEMHGSAFKTTCLQCKHVRLSYETLLSPALGDILPSEETLAAAVSSDSASSGLKEIPTEDLPRCGGLKWNGSNRYGRCGGLLRPQVVWFGEVPEGMGEIARVLNWTEVLIVVGTSSLVYPAAGFAKTVKDRGGKVAVFNLERSQGDEQADFLFLGPCEDVLPRVLGL